MSIEYIDIVHHLHTDLGYTDYPLRARKLHAQYVGEAVDAVLDTRIAQSPFAWTAKTLLGVEEWLRRPTRRSATASIRPLRPATWISPWSPSTSRHFCRSASGTSWCTGCRRTSIRRYPCAQPCRTTSTAFRRRRAKAAGSGRALPLDGAEPPLGGVPSPRRTLSAGRCPMAAACWCG